jgi:hypothetical protein
MRGSSSRMFPVGLYATLLLALCCVAVPELGAPAEAALRTVQTWPLRWAAEWTPRTPLELDPQRIEALAAELERREVAAALRGGRPPSGALVPVVCRVLALEGRGGADLPSRLVLDRGAADLAGTQYVTYGDALVGFITADRSGAARVTMLHERRLERHLLAAGIQGAAGELRCIVEPSRGSDRLPLRCRLPSEPYRVHELPWQALPVVTAGFDGYGADRIPPGLRIGELELEGYRAEGIVVGLFVRPAVDPRALAVVVAWRDRGEPVQTAAPWRGERAPARLLPLTRTRALAITDGELPARAALTRGELLVGLVERSGYGQGVAVAVGHAGWLRAFTWLPEDPALPPLPLTGRLHAQGEHSALLELDRPAATPRGPGRLFTGPASAHCPAGLLIGRGELIDSWRLLLELPDLLARSDVAELRRAPSESP